MTHHTAPPCPCPLPAEQAPSPCRVPCLLSSPGLRQTQEWFSKIKRCALTPGRPGPASGRSKNPSVPRTDTHTEWFLLYRDASGCLGSWPIPQCFLKGKSPAKLPNRPSQTKESSPDRQTDICSFSPKSETSLGSFPQSCSGSSAPHLVD